MFLRYFIIVGLCMVLNLKGHAQTFYNTNAIQKIEVYFANPKWDYMLDTSKFGKEGYVMAQWVKINGTQYDSVGVRYKGNSSYDSTRLKNPIHIELDAYKDQDHQGYEDIKLSNCYQDPSMIREVLAYKILKNYMHCPDANFAQVYINGTYIGVYSNTESINKTFCGNHFYSSNGTFIKGNPQVVPSVNTKSNLKQLSGDSSAYFNYYEIKSDHGWKQLEALSDSVTNHPNTISNVMDVDRAIWMLAFNNVLINLDSYSGAFCQNYYLYKDHTQHYNPIVWDLNMSFGGFPFLGNLNTSLGSLTIPSMQILPISAHSNDAYWPLIKAVYNNPFYKRMLVAHTRTMLNEMFVSNSYITDYNQFKTLVDTAVLSDTRKFFTYAQFQNALTNNYSVGSYSVPGIQTLMNGRISYLQSTADFTVATPTITGATATTGSPALNTQVTFTASVVNATGVYFGSRFSPGNKFNRLLMYDDGAHNDGTAGDNIYGVSITMTDNQVQYYIYAENASAGIFSPERAEHEFHELKIYQQPTQGDVVINEFLAKNKSDVKNEFNLEEDWIELYNNTAAPLSLSNYYLSDDKKEKTKFAFPKNTVIQPHGYLIVWADNITLSGNQMHAPFKLDEDGDKIILSNGLRAMDEIYFGEQVSDISVGRCPNGTGNFKILTYPSYGMNNCTVGLAENSLNANDFIMYPNPAGSYFNIKAGQVNKQSIEITNALGQMIYENIFSENIIINTAGWQSGLYLVKCNSSTKKLIINN